MGYTHYWRQDRDFTKTEWLGLVDSVGKILEVCRNNKIELVKEYDSSDPPVINGETIHFNGRKEDGHETFVIERIRPELQPWMGKEHFDFCKTAQKPYDVAVCMVLLAINQFCPGVMRISSDGNWDDDWGHAAVTFRNIFGLKVKPSCPWGDTN